jgi:hypothetical protein
MIASTSEDLVSHPVIMIKKEKMPMRSLGAIKVIDQLLREKLCPIKTNRYAMVRQICEMEKIA